MKKYLFYLFYILSPVILISRLYTINPLKYNNFSLLVAMCIGASAYTWFIWQFILSSRPKFLELFVGLDKIYKLHGIMAVVSVSFAFIHNYILGRFFSNSVLTWMGSITSYIYLMVTILAIIILMKRVWNKYKILNKLSVLLKSFRYEHHKLFHNISIVGLLTMQVHVLMTSSAVNFRSIYMTYMIYFQLAVGFYLYHKLLRPWIQRADKLEVINVVKENDNIYRIDFKSINHNIDYKSGQFGFFTFAPNGQKEEHPFTLSSSPSNEAYMSITIKSLGDFTENIERVCVGDLISFDGPYGEFSYDNYPKDKSLMLVAGGVGITPMISMLENLSVNDKEKNVVLLWGMRHFDDYIMHEKLSRINNLMKNLLIVPVMSNEIEYAGEKGYIDKDKISYYLNYLDNQKKNIGFYICGPPALRINSIGILKKIGIASHKIHYETFTF